MEPHRRAKPAGKGADSAAAARRALGAQSGLRAAQGAAGRGRYRRQPRCSASAAAIAELLERLEKVQREQPGLLAEYQNMDRDYGVLRKNYEELLEPAAVGQHRAGGRYPGRQGQAADRRSARRRRGCRPRRTGCCWCPASCSRDSAAALRFTILLGQLDRSFSTVDRPAQSRPAGARRHFDPGSAAIRCNA